MEAGLGALPRIAFNGTSIYRGRLWRSEAEARLAQIYRPYHRALSGLIRRAQAAGGVVAERDPDAEAWIFISLGLLTTIDRRLGNLVGDELEDIFASRRAWMTGSSS